MICAVNIQHTCAIALLYFFLWLQFCALLVGLILAQNPELILVLVKKKSISIRLTIELLTWSCIIAVSNNTINGMFCRMMQNVRLRANNHNIDSQFAASTLTKREYLCYCGNFYCNF